jgi:hypothetical protein
MPVAQHKTGGLRRSRRQWPHSSFYVLGIFLGIDLIFIGSSWFTIGLALKRRHTG